MNLILQQQMRKVSHFLILIFFSGILSCDQEEVINRSVFRFDAVSSVTFNDAQFSGTIAQLNSGNYTDYGFVWGYNHLPTIADSVFSFGQKPAPGKIEQKIPYSWEPRITFYARMYIKGEARIIYSNELKFSGPATAPVTVTSYSPKIGVAGTKIKVVGKFLNQATADKTSLKIGNLILAPDSAMTSTIIRFRIPTDVQISGDFDISFVSGDVTVPLPGKFTIIGPVIDSFSPTAGTPGSQIVITGKNFDPVAANNFVVASDNDPFGGSKQLVVVSATSTQIIATIPLISDYTHSFDLSLRIKSITVVAAGRLTIEGGEITSYSPTSARPGETITINGRNFSDISSENVVTFNGIEGQTLTATPTQLTIFFPEKITNSYYKTPAPLYVYTHGNQFPVSAPSPDLFTPRPPFIKKTGLSQQFPDNYAYFAIGSSAYALQLFGSSGHLFQYNTTADAWTTKADFPGAGRVTAVAFSVNGKGYVGGGFNYLFGQYTPSKDFWEYDPGNDAWTQKQDIPWSSSQGTDERVMSIGSKAYVVANSVVYQYESSTDQWTVKSNPFPGDNLQGSVSFVIGNKGYTGFGNTPFSPDFLQFWKYDPASDLWTRVADFPESTQGMGYTSLSDGSKGYIELYEFSNFEAKEDFYQFDPDTNTWSKMPDSKIDGIGLEINGAGYIFQLGATGDVYMLDPFYHL
jgi:N-acetylneuraminic acid mutarotase